MCSVCELVAGSDPDDALERVRAAVEGGVPAEHFKEVLDRVLGTEEPETDRESDDVFERSYRDRR